MHTPWRYRILALHDNIAAMIVYAVVDDTLSPDFPLGVELEVSIRREDADRFIEEVRGDDPELASYLRIEGARAGGGRAETWSAPGRSYLSAGRNEPELSFFAARFSLRRSLSVFCGFCFCCLFGLSELLLMGAAEQ